MGDLGDLYLYLLIRRQRRGLGWKFFLVEWFVEGDDGVVFGREEEGYSMGWVEVYLV